MRLEKIKLAGFKSFVDPTVVPLPSNLVAVVGPNGCGKSNVIDAVRWVMGESSAKMLRGESMADVIFNGSSARKPVGNAQIELVFDNSDGGAGGQYANYNTISVKRQVSRDGQSNYYLNSTRCRRRDITDLFLGTGLGPRSYSIIEQGTISRLIEARPEELRAFLEEAAGISKYKERRRETENRIRHTRENLDRLNDLREEVEKHLQHLERQAATAERYKKLRQEERRLKAELLALRRRDLQEGLDRKERVISGLETEVESALAEQRRLEAELEEGRARQHEANDLFNDVQERFYAVGAEIARTEQSLQYNREARRRRQEEMQQVEAELSAIDEQLAQDQSHLEELERTLAEQEPELERLVSEEETRRGALEDTEAEMHTWQTEWEEFNRSAAEPAQLAQVERTRINHLEQQLLNHERRLAKLAEEGERLDDSGLARELEELTGLEEEFAQIHAVHGETLESVAERLQTMRNDLAELNDRLDDCKQELQHARGRRTSLEALQQAALGQDDDKLAQWLERQGLAQSARLADLIRVERDWQHGVEVVLGDALQAVYAESLDRHRDGLTDGAGAALNLFEKTSRTASPRSSGDSLLARIEADFSLDGMLSGVRTAVDADDALSRRAQLADGESFVTPEGLRVGPDWLQFPGEGGVTGGVLERAAELQQLEERIEELEHTARQLAEDSALQQDAIDDTEAQREDARAERDQASRELSRIRNDASVKRTRLEHLEHRRETVAAERRDINRQVEQDKQAVAQCRERLHQALSAMETLAARRDQLVSRRDQLRDRTEQARAAARSVTEQTRALAVKVESARTARRSLATADERLQGQLAQLTQRRDKLAQAENQGAEPLHQLEAQLESQLQQRVQVEGELADARRVLEEVEAGLRDGEQARQRAEQHARDRRTELEQARMQRQEVLVRGRTLDEQLRESGFEARALLDLLPNDAAEADWQNEVEKIGARIQRLGAINLAAIEEFKTESERKRYLDEQHADVTRSLETLEEAIRKIDRETRTRFKDTFDKVNSGLKALFPRLFGGGHAYLDLTGEDLLDTGVTVMARPPGKRNSSIHLLSGGEKALTAVALVFSIFQLNPSPFCMLDEVDAPLDDANVGRFCELVKSMSDQVQFIFITHNKVTMEMANQLTGVTMNEPGVSRLVSVDVDEAVKLAAI